MTDILIPLPWAAVAPCSRVMLPSGRIVHVQYVLRPDSASSAAARTPILVGLRNEHGQDRAITVGPADLALTIVGEQDLAVAALRTAFPDVEFLREVRS